jgi:aspartyl-tRNA(Asn)/glutamyl-tRNA(Gln) amidotransferase subunit C
MFASLLHNSHEISAALSKAKRGCLRRTRPDVKPKSNIATEPALMSIDTDTARKVAHLARIAVAEENLPALAGELSGILNFMEQLNEVDVEGIEPMTSVTPMRLKRRQDMVTDGNIQAAVLKNAPDTREGFFAVPKVVE